MGGLQRSSTAGAPARTRSTPRPPGPPAARVAGIATGSGSAKKTCCATRAAGAPDEDCPGPQLQLTRASGS